MIKKIDKGKYRVRVVYRDYSNKKREISRTAESRQEAIKIERELKTLYGNSHHADNNLTLPDEFMRWYRTFKKNQICPRTQLKYQRTYNSLVKMNMNSLPLADLTPERYQQLINDYAQSHALDTVQCFHSHLKGALAYAVQNSLIDKNPAKYAKIWSNVTSKPAGAKFMDESELNKVLPILLDDPTPRYDMAKLVLLIILNTGLRPGEALGLTWNNVDFSNRCITVDHSYNYATKKMDGLKTDSSERTLEVSQPVFDIFARIQKFQSHHHIDKCKQNPKQYIFMSFNRTVMTDSSLNKQFRKYQQQAGIEAPWVDDNGKERYYVAYAFRHDNASLMLMDSDGEIDVAKAAVVAERLGHKNPQMTLTTYQHVFTSSTQKHNAALDKSINRLYDKARLANVPSK